MTDDVVQRLGVLVHANDLGLSKLQPTLSQPQRQGFLITIITTQFKTLAVLQLELFCDSIEQSFQKTKEKQ